MGDDDRSASGDVATDRGNRREAEVLLAAAAHELRTPIATVCGLVEMLRAREQYLASDDREALWDALSRQSLRLGELVNDLFDVSAFDGGRECEPVAVPVARAVTDALESAPPPAGIAVTVTVSGSPDGCALGVYAERNALARVLVNLLTNAYRYGARDVTVRALRRGSEVVLAIDDDGPGVPDEIRMTLFEPFVRGSNSAGHHGIGIGLALVKQLVHNAGGRLSYEPRTPSGSSFLIALPYAPCDDVTVPFRRFVGFPRSFDLRQSR